MLQHLKRLRSRASETAERAASGSAVPAGIEADDSATPTPTARERGTMRRRLRGLSRRREAMLLELGALVFELHRRGRRDSELVERRAGALGLVDEEMRGLARALDADRTLDDVVAAGLAVRCLGCGGLVSTDAAFCSTCGMPVGGSASASDGASGGPMASGEPAPTRAHGES